MTTLYELMTVNDHIIRVERRPQMKPTACTRPSVNNMFADTFPVIATFTVIVLVLVLVMLIVISTSITQIGQ